jgi:hypothetical protein
MKTDILLQIVLKKQRAKDQAAEIIPAILQKHLSKMLALIPMIMLRAERDNVSKDKILIGFREYILAFKAQLADPLQPKNIICNVKKVRSNLKNSAKGNEFCNYIDDVEKTYAEAEQLNTEFEPQHFVPILADNSEKAQ